MKKNQTSTKILNAFSNLLIEKGYQGATTKLVAKDSEVNESTIYRHFGDKKGLLDALIAEYMKDLDETINKINAEILKTNDIESCLIFISKVYIDFINKHKAISLLNDPSFPSDATKASDILKIKAKEFIKAIIEMFYSRGEVSKKLDLETETVNFILLNFGFALITINKNKQSNILTTSENDFLEKNVREFAKHLKRDNN